MELAKKTPAELDTLINEERKKEREEDAEREKRRPFNLPDSKADFGFWGKASYWTLDEAIALSFGKRPEVANWPILERLVRQSPFAFEYSQRRELAKRALAIRQLSDPVIPSAFVAWAKRIDLPFPPELGQFIPLADINWKARYEAEVTEHDKTKAALATTTAALREQEEKPVGKREWDSLLKMVIGMAIGGYGLDPQAGRTPIAAQIATDLLTNGIALDEDTIRKFLHEAKQLLPQNETEQKR